MINTEEIFGDTSQILVKVDARGILEIENIGRGVILGRKGHEFNTVLFEFERPKRHQWSFCVVRHMDLGLGHCRES